MDLAVAGPPRRRGAGRRPVRRDGRGRPHRAGARRRERPDPLARLAAERGREEEARRPATEERPLPPEADLAAYRIVQESLTNVTRHSDAASARVRVRYRDDALELEIEDDGPAAANPSPGGGTGIDGMRDRARALGGELTARSRPGGGFRVRARLPLPADRSPAS
ncbi:MAG: hypothetical protein IRY90_03235 [Actinomadura rubrobrunea]|nr:hypothetical protein [Actinomadura rubrobrunea]